MKYASIILTICLFLLNLGGFAQTEVVIQVESTIGERPSYHHVDGDNLWVLFGSSNQDIWRVDLKHGETHEIGQFSYIKNIIHSSLGFSFYHANHSSNGTYYEVCNITSSDSVFTIQNGWDPRSTKRIVIAYYNNTYYIGTSDTSHSQLYSWDGRSNTLDQIFTSPGFFGALKGNEEGLHFVINKVDGYNCYFLSSNTGLTLTQTINSDFIYAAAVGEQKESIFYSLRTSETEWKVYKSERTKVEYFCDHINTQTTIRFDGEYIYFDEALTKYIDYNGHSYVADTSELFFEKLKTPKILEEVGHSYVHIANNYYWFGSDATGQEIMYSDGDSVKALDQLNPGPASSFTNIWPAKDDLVYHDGTLYALATNRADDFSYLYAFSPDKVECLYKIGDEYNVSSLFIRNDSIYWIEAIWNDSTYYTDFRLNRRSLSDRQVQPDYEEISSDVWYRQILQGNRQYYPDLGHKVNPLAIEIDQNNDIIGLVFNSNGYRDYAYDQRTFKKYDPASVNMIFKYSEEGDLLWIKSIGTTTPGNSSYTNQLKLKLTSNGDIIIAGYYFDQGVFDKDTINNPRCNYFLSKLDGQTGEIVWTKYLHTLHYAELKFDAMTLDDEDNIYIALLYPYYGLTLGSYSIVSNLDPTNAMVKFSKDGEIEWLRNTATPWTDTYGNTRVLDFDKKNNAIVAVQTQGYYNWSSSCKYSNWGYNFQNISKSGTLLDSLHFSGDDLGGLGTGTMDDEGKLYTFGFHRNQLDIPNFRHNTGSCENTVGFGLTFSPRINDVTAVLVGDHSSLFKAVDTKVANGYIYIYGTGDRGRLYLLKYTTDGKYIGYKDLLQVCRIDVPVFNFFDVKDGYIVILGSTFSSNTEFGVTNFSNFDSYISVLKIKDENWSTDQNWMKPYSTFKEDEFVKQFKVYPNPIHDKAKIVFDGEQCIFTEFRVYDIKGASLGSGPLTTDAVQELDLSLLKPGMYIIQFLSDEGAEAVKVVKE